MQTFVHMHGVVLPAMPNASKQMKKALFGLSAVAHMLFEFKHQKERQYGG